MADTAHVTSAVAVDNARVWRLARADFDALLGRHEGLLRSLAALISERQAQANARLAAETAPDEARTQRGYVTAVYSPRGGAGVTTLAVTLAIALAEGHPDDTVLLDLDVLFGHALSNLWMEPRGVLAQASPVTLQALERAGLDFYLMAHPSSLRIFPAASRPEEGQAITGEHIRAALISLRRHFGHIVLDLPHGFSEVTLAGLELADRVLLVATPEQVTLHDVLECRRIFGEVLRLRPERIGYVLNHPSPYAGVPAGEFAAATAASWAEIPFGGEGPSTAALRGESLLNTRPNNPVTRAAVAFADTIATEARELAALAGRPY
jgi:pilus assembly protein CpaE